MKARNPSVVVLSVVSKGERRGEERRGEERMGEEEGKRGGEERRGGEGVGKWVVSLALDLIAETGRKQDKGERCVVRCCGGPVGR